MKCAPAIEAKIGRPLTDREKGEVARQAKALLDKMNAAGSSADAEAVLQAFKDRITANGILAKRTEALNYMAREAKVAYRKNVDFVSKNPADGIVAQFRGSLYDFEGSKRSLAQLAYHESTARSQAYTADLLNGKLFDYAFSGKDDENIGMAIHDIQNGKDPTARGADAAKVAKIITDHQEALRSDLNSAGANIDKNSDRMFRRTHDAYSIARAGDQLFGSDGAFAAWMKQGNLDHLDWTKAFDGDLNTATNAEKTSRLRSLFNQFAAGEHLNYGTDPSAAKRGFGNISSKHAAQRELVFDDPKYDIQYNKAFGTGNSIAEGVFHSMSSGGKDVAIMREWGPNAEMNMRKYVEDWKKELKDTNRPEDMAKLSKAFDGEMNNTWKLLQRPAAHPTDNFVARTFSAVRQTTGTAAIGMSVFSNIGDLPLRASQLAMYGEGGVLKNLATSTAHMVTGSGLSVEAQRNLAAEAGIRLESVHMPLDPNMADHVGFGQLAGYNQQS